MSGRERSSTSLAELLCALSFATDLGVGQAMEHGLKSAYIGLALADAIGLAHADREAVFYGALIKDAGCTACAPVFATFFAGDDLGPRRDRLLLKPDSMQAAVAWFWRHAPEDAGLPRRIAGLFSFLTECRAAMKESMTAHCEIGELFARRLGLPEPVQRTVRFLAERWDGSGPVYGLRGADVPVAARILHLAQVVEVARYFGGVTAAEAVARERRGSDFDPDLVGALLELSRRPGFWAVPAQETAQDTVLALRPRAPFDAIPPDQLETICEVLADFADVKSRTTWNHSPTVADTAVRIGSAMGLQQTALTRLRRAALLHDLGHAAVPVGILEKADNLSAGEWERFRLHPYYTERILARVAPLNDLAAEAASHHEAVDGQGYPRGLTGSQIALGGRILAVADEYATRAREQDGSGEAEPVLRALRPLAGTRLDAQCYEALVAAWDGRAPRSMSRSRQQRGVAITEREREVLQLVGSGLSNREIARQLVISEKTVEHHLEHIFNKLGVSCRTAAAVSGVLQGLVG